MDTACNLYHRCVTRRSNDDWNELTRRYGCVFRQLIRQALVSYGVALTEQDLDEYVQEMYLRLLTSPARFRGDQDQELWLYLGRMARNMLIDRWRILCRQRRLAAKAELAAKRARQVADPAASPEKRAMARQRLGHFLDGCRWAANGRQVELKLRILCLVYVDGFSSREIACRLEDPVTPTQIDSMLFRLRQRLARRGVEIPRRQRTGSLAAAPETFIHQ